MAETSNVILTHDEIVHKIKRIAYQIYESNVEEEEIILAGIENNGYVLAKKTKNCFEKNITNRTYTLQSFD